MKRLIVIIIFLFVLMTSAFSEERVWYMDSNNFKNNVNLENTFYLPTYTLDWADSDTDMGSAEKGTYSKINTLGNFGVFECDHRIEFFIETDGRFVSQSDNTKYREFYIAFRPRCLAGKDTNYNLGTNGIDIQTTDRLPNTKATGTLDYIAPAVPAGGKKTRIDSNGTTKTITRFHSDLILCMDELTPQDKQHIAETDDYVAEITLGWRCAEAGCTNPKHQGSFHVVILGYYHTGVPASSHVTMFVNPDPNSTSLDLEDIVRTKAGKANVAELKIFATSSKDNKWDTKLFTFLSASDDYTKDTESFVLTNNRTGKTIPFTVSIYNEQGDEIKNFNGKSKYTGKMADCISLTPYMTTIGNREGNNTYSVVFVGTVGINLLLTAEEIDNDALLQFQQYPGMYTSTIYYHIVTNGNTI